LTHLIATALANYVLNPALPRHQAALCANGFRDTTRIASGSPEMWRDIALANRKSLRVALDDFVRELQRVQTVLRRGRGKDISELFETAKERRDRWCSRCISPSSE
jgi:prephenate dehydrogenase